MCIEEKNDYRYDVRYCFEIWQDRPTEPFFHGGSREVERARREGVRLMEKMTSLVRQKNRRDIGNTHRPMKPAHQFMGAASRA